VRQRRARPRAIADHVRAETGREPPIGALEERAGVGDGAAAAALDSDRRALDDDVPRPTRTSCDPTSGSISRAGSRVSTTASGRSSSCATSPTSRRTRSREARRRLADARLADPARGTRDDAEVDRV